MPETGHGAFSHFVLEGLRGAAPTDPNGLITVTALSNWVRQQVEDWTRDKPSGRQSPRLDLREATGDLPLAVSKERLEALEEQKAKIREAVQKLSQMFTDGALTPVQHSLVQAALASNDEERRQIALDVSAGTLRPQYIEALLKSVPPSATPGPAATLAPTTPPPPVATVRTPTPAPAKPPPIAATYIPEKISSSPPAAVPSGPQIDPLAEGAFQATRGPYEASVRENVPAELDYYSQVENFFGEHNRSRASIERELRSRYDSLSRQSIEILRLEAISIDPAASEVQVRVDYRYDFTKTTGARLQGVSRNLILWRRTSSGWKIIDHDEVVEKS